MKKNDFLFSTLSILTLTFVSCTKQDITTKTDNSPVAASATIDAINELDITTGTQVSFDHSTSKTTAKSLTGSCAIVTMNPQTTTFPKTFYVDFGTSCSTNSITRTGKLKITFSNTITESGSTMTVERVNYYINGNKVEGTIVYKNTTISPTLPQWTRTVTNGKFTNTKGEVFLNSGTHTVKQTVGVTTLALDDNIYEITNGTQTVTRENGAKTMLTIIEPLIKNFSCDYVSKGKIKVEDVFIGFTVDGTIDYGNGDCDNKGIFTQNGIAFPISM